MDDSFFWLAAQSSLILGLIHGINPCGHSWLVLAPFVTGQRQGWQVAVLTVAFLAGTSLACLLIGLGLGGISTGFTVQLRLWADLALNLTLVLIGGLLLVRPSLLHSHEHGHCDHHGSTPCSGCGHTGKAEQLRRISAFGLFSIGFANMVIPCPTVAIMYRYALGSGSALKSAAVFLLYALTTAIAVGGVIYALFRLASLVRRLEQHWVEPAIMRTVGVMTLAFATYSLIQGG